MKRAHRTTRRSFLVRVAGAAAVGSGLSGCVGIGPTDADSGPYADPAGMGRGTVGRYGTSGITDSDAGQYADPAGNGRGGGYSTGVTDSDSGQYADPAGRGRGTGITDSDSGAYADPAGQGRGRGSYQSGLTDSHTDTIVVEAGGCFVLANGQVVIEAENYTETAPGTGSASGSSWLSYADATASNSLAVRAEPNTGAFTGLNLNGPRLHIQRNPIDDPRLDAGDLLARVVDQREAGIRIDARAI